MDCLDMRHLQVYCKKIAKSRRMYMTTQSIHARCLLCRACGGDMTSLESLVTCFLVLRETGSGFFSWMNDIRWMKELAGMQKQSFELHAWNVRRHCKWGISVRTISVHANFVELLVKNRDRRKMWTDCSLQYYSLEISMKIFIFRYSSRNNLCQ